MPLFPITHFQWQVLRAVKRNRKPVLGRELRLSPTRGTKDGEFLNTLAFLGLITRLEGTEDRPFEAIYSLTELGKHAAEYGECEMEAAVFNAPLEAKRNKKKTAGRDRRAG
jgi:hypothetical protein